jgi:beta-hydroxylase
MADGQARERAPAEAAPPAQARKTEGLADTMSRPGLAGRLVEGFVAWAERLNLRHAVHGNPPVYDTGTFPWAEAVEAEWPLIRAELDRVLTRKEELPGFHEIAADVRSISTDAGWKSFLICGYGLRSEQAIKACPETWRILKRIPGLKTALFSIFEPGKHLPAHRGPYNGVLRFHLGLRVPDAPDKIGIKVGGRLCHWREGKALIFDDAFEHEAWNHSGEVRVVLFVDFVKPTHVPARLVNWLVLNLAVFTPFIREGYKAQKAWEKLFFGGGDLVRRG